METYECIRCGYITDKKHNFKRHILREIPCKPTLNKISKKKLIKRYISIFPEFDGHKELKTRNLCCEFCNKKFSDYSCKWRHQKKSCKEKNATKKLNNRIKKLEDELNKLRSTTINNGTMVNGNVGGNVNMNNNVTVNNNIEIVQLGYENLSQVLSQKEQVNILERGYYSPNFLIEHVHFNKKYPQYNSFRITNLKDSNAQMYSSTKKDFITVSKDRLLTDLIDYKANDLHDMYNKNKHLLPAKVRVTIEKLIDMLNSDDDKFANVKKKELLNLIYDETKKLKKLN